jgi:wyosine [tRNA(Phe)-imidazoG37] synthetase (radical SAM superfamily)
MNERCVHLSPCREEKRHDKMKQRVPYATEIVYGPVPSRRLGLSLGLNVFPARKVCNFDCLYCHCGRGSEQEAKGTPTALPSATEVGRALSNYLRSSPHPEVITFAGNGEPTLHPHFAEIVAEVIQVRDQLAPGLPLAILSNSTRVTDARVRSALLTLDRRVMKLDTAEQDTFLRLDRPRPWLGVADVIAGLCRLRPVILQVLFVEGAVANTSETHVESLIAACKQIQPGEVQVYTAVRWTAERCVRAVGRPRLEQIAARINAAGIRARVY